MNAVALNLAARGFRVFPLAPGAKHPLRRDWQNTATSDALTILENWPLENVNVGIATDGLVVIDADAAKGGLESLSRFNGLPPTFTVRTARGGVHLYFAAPPGTGFANRVNAFKDDGLPGIDIRAAGGLVVGPGSTFEGREYVVERDAPVAPLPTWLAERLNAAPQRTAEAGTSIGPTDSPGAIDAACTWLLTQAPIAVEGDGGDTTTYQVAARVLDFGVSPQTAADLMADHWNERCEPPWDFEDLERKVANAAAYRQDPIGRENPDAAGFGAIEYPPDFQPERVGFASLVEPFDLTAQSVAEIPRRPWLAYRRLMRGKVTNLVAPGSAGKSLLSLQWAAALALGSGEFTDLELRERCNVLVINNEDEALELKRRLGAVFGYFNLPWHEAHDRLFLYSGIIKKFKAVVRAKGGKLGTSPEFRELADYVAANDIGLIVFDTLASVHEADENSNTEMQIVMEAMTTLAAVTNAAILNVHHTNKPPSASSDSFAGNMYAGRGATAVVNAARVQLTLFGMSEKDGTAYGIPAHVRHRYVRLDDAKANLYLANPNADWFEKATVKLPNGEDLGVLNPVKLTKHDDAQVTAALELIAGVSETEITVGAAVAILADNPMFRGRGRHTLESLVLDMLKNGPRKATGKTLTLDRKNTRRGGVIELKSSD